MPRFTDPASRGQVTDPSIDITDRPAFVVWLAALYRFVMEATAVGFDATAKPEHRNISLPVARDRMVAAIGEIETLFAQVKPLLKEGGIPVYVPPPLAPRNVATGDEKDVGKKLRRGRKRGEL